MFGGIDLHVVEPGTEIKHEGETRTVTEIEAVQRGRHVYLTQKHYDALKAHPEVQTREPGG